MRKFISLLLALVMVFSLTITASAEDSVIAPASPETSMAGKVVILHTNDVHGSIEGYGYVKALKDVYAAKGAEVILVDAGDFSQGTTYVSTTKGADAVTMMNAVGYDFVTLGNHEFDYGYEQLKDNLSKAAFKVLCADVFGADGKLLYDANATYTTKGGLKIGFFGMETPEAQTKTNPALIKGLKFLSGQDMFTCAQAQVGALKDADLVVCLGHLGIDNESVGNRSVDLLNAVTGIDLFIDGHSHSTIDDLKAVTNENCTVNGTKITSTGTAIANVGVVVIDEATKTVESCALVPTEGLLQDETVAAAAKVIVDRVKAEYGEVFAKSTVTLNGDKAPNGNRDSETNNGDLITDAMLWTVLKDKGSVTVPADHVVAITNGGGIRAAIKPGDVTKNDINTVLPFGNTVAVVYVTGAELLEALEASTYCTPEAVGAFPQIAGMDVSVATYKDYIANAETYPGSTYYGPASINRVTVNSVNGKALNMTDTYAVVTNNFCAAGGDTYYAFASATSQFDTGIPLDEAVMDYVKTELKGVIGEKYAKPQTRLNIYNTKFADVPASNTFAAAIKYVTDNGYFNGNTDTTFNPKGNVTRGQLAAVLYRMAGSPAVSGEAKFSDVAAGKYYTDAVIWANANGIVTGYSDGTFGPAKNITRAQLATMLWRYAKFAGVDVSVGEETNILSYEDALTLAEPFIPAMQWACGAGIVNGNGGYLNHGASATRGQVAAMLYRYCTAAAAPAEEAAA